MMQPCREVVARRAPAVVVMLYGIILRNMMHSTCTEFAFIPAHRSAVPFFRNVSAPAKKTSAKR